MEWNVSFNQFLMNRINFLSSLLMSIITAEYLVPQKGLAVWFLHIISHMF